MLVNTNDGAFDPVVLRPHGEDFEEESPEVFMLGATGPYGISDNGGLPIDITIKSIEQSGQQKGRGIVYLPADKSSRLRVKLRRYGPVEDGTEVVIDSQPCCSMVPLLYYSAPIQWQGNTMEVDVVVTNHGTVNWPLDLCGRLIGARVVTLGYTETLADESAPTSIAKSKCDVDREDVKVDDGAVHPSSRQDLTTTLRPMLKGALRGTECHRRPLTRSNGCVAYSHLRAVSDCEEDLDYGPLESPISAKVMVVSETGVVPQNRDGLVAGKVTDEPRPSGSTPVAGQLVGRETRLIPT